jgi:hypothetical protein
MLVRYSKLDNAVIGYYLYLCMLVYVTFVYSAHKFRGITMLQHIK